MNSSEERQLDRIENTLSVLDARFDELDKKVAILLHDEERRVFWFRFMVGAVITETLAVASIFLHWR